MTAAPTFSDADPLDAQVIAAVNAHQLGDKGFGPALGPRAAEFADADFSRPSAMPIVQGRSDWVAGPADRDFQLALLAGWRQAAEEIGEIPREALESWFTRRREAARPGA